MESQEEEVDREQRLHAPMGIPNVNGENHDTTMQIATKKTNMQIVFNKDRITGLYKCHMCSYKSMHRSSIKSHYAVHSSLRPYACDQCAYEAKRLNDLRKHKLIKHGKKLISVRKKYGAYDTKKTSSQSPRSPTHAPLPPIAPIAPAPSAMDTNADHAEAESHTRNLLYQSLIGVSSENGPVFPQPEPANNMSSLHSQEHIAQPERIRSVSTGDIPEEVDREEGTVVVKPEPPDDYYTFQRNLVEQEGPITIPREESPPPQSSDNEVHNTSALSSNRLSPGNCSPKSPRGSALSPASSLKSVAQSTSKEAGEADSSRMQAASPSVISLLLQRRNLTGASMLTPNSSTASQPRQLRSASKPFSSSSGNYFPGDSSAASPNQEPRAARFASAQYNPLNLSYNQQQATRSSSESSHSSQHNTPSSTSGGRSVGAETKRGWLCDHCNIMFFDSAIYFMHMGLHSPDSAWQCNLCGEHLFDVYSFTSHFVNGHVSS